MNAPTVKTSEFLAALFDGCDGHIEARALPSRARLFVPTTDPAALARFVQDHGREDLYMGVAARASAGDGTAANCAQLGAVFCDIDFKGLSEVDARVKLADCPVPPSIIVESGGGLHAYWLLREPAPVAEVVATGILARLAAYLGGDRSCAEPARVLRLPNTKNHKYSPARVVTIAYWDPDHRVNLSDFDMLPAVEATPGAVANVPGQPFVIPETVEAGDRNATLFKLARALKAKGLPGVAILEALRAANARFTPPHTDAEVARVYQSAASQRDREGFEAAAPAVSGLQRLSSVQGEAIDWVWKGRLAKGKYTLLAGDPGKGKSRVTFDLAARITVGAEWPDGGRAPIGNVLFLAGEDSVVDTIQPMCARMGADLDRIWMVKGVPEGSTFRHVNLAQDLPWLIEQIREVQPALIVVDPIMAYLGGVNVYKDAEVRSILNPFCEAVAETGAALLCVAHLTKDTNREALYRPGGSIAFAAAARLVLMLGADPVDDERRAIVSIKENICRAAPAVAFRILEGGAVAWEYGPCSLTKDDFSSRDGRKDGHSKRDDDCAAWLAHALKDGQPAPSEDVLAAGQQAGYSRNRLFEVKKLLGVKAKKRGWGDDQQWMWEIPAPAAPARLKIVGSVYTGEVPEASDAGLLDDKAA